MGRTILRVQPHFWHLYHVNRARLLVADILLRQDSQRIMMPILGRSMTNQTILLVFAAACGFCAFQERKNFTVCFVFVVFGLMLLLLGLTLGTQLGIHTLSQCRFGHLD